MTVKIRASAWQVFCLLCLLCSPIAADEFLDALDLNYPRYDWNGALQAVLDSPERAEKAIPGLMSLASRASRSRARELLFYVDFINRVLHVHAGRPAPGKQLTSWKWSKTPIAGKPSEVNIGEVEDKARTLWKQAALAVDVGAYGKAEKWLREAIFASHRIAWARQPVPQDLLQLQKRYRIYIMGLSETGYIHPQSADTVVLQELSGGRKEAAQLGLMAFVQSGRLEFKPSTVDKYLPRLLKRSDAQMRFAAESFQQERLMQKSDLSRAEFMKRHDQVWKHFPESDKTAADPLFAPLRRRWIAEAAEFWLSEVQARIKEPGAPELLARDFERLTAAGFGWLEVNHLLDQALAASQKRDYITSEKLVRQAEPALSKFRRSAKVKEERFWSYVSTEKVQPKPAATRLGFLEAQLHYIKYLNVLKGRKNLGGADFAQATSHLKFVAGATDRFERRIPVLAALAHHSLLSEGRSPAMALEKPRNALLLTEIASHIFDDPVQLAKVLVAQGRLNDHLSQRDAAQESYRLAVEKVEEYLKATSAAPNTVRRIRNQVRAAYEAHAQTLIAEGKNEEALDLLSRLAQVQNRDHMQAALAHSATNEVTRTLRQADQLQRTTLQLEKRAQETVNSQAPTRAEDLRVVSELLADTRAQYYQTIKELQRKEPDFTRLSVRPLNFARIQSSIPTDTTVVQYFPAEKSLYIFVANAQSLKVRTVPIARVDLEKKALKALRALSNASLQAVDTDMTHPSLSAMTDTLSELNEILVAPIKEDLGERPVLAVIPTGRLSYVPFPALVTGTRKDRPRFLVEELRTVTILKAVDLDSLLRPPPSRTGALVGFGNPDGTLAQAEREVIAIGKLFNDQSVVTSKGTIAKLKEMCATKPAFLHLATHGQVNSREPLESYLVMADGNLSLADITALKIGEPSLVTLSACNTGLGEFSVSPGQDLTTLAEAFWFAGGRSLVASLWMVSDRSTASLMVEFYKGMLAGQSKAQALQNAQLAVLAETETSAPYHWAPFVLIGDWR